jgi:ubiquinone/menaquinone biosynthesis C-methylase UbiE
MACLFDNPLRRLVHSPRKLFGDYLFPGMTAFDIGCGMGFFSIGMAKIVGEQGRVLAVDLQPRMLAVLNRRAESAGVKHIIDTRQCTEKRLGIPSGADFVLLFWSMHEIPDTEALATEIRDALKPGGFCYVAEPAFHVSKTALETQIAALSRAGLNQVTRPRVTFSRAVLLQRQKAG